MTSLRVAPPLQEPFTFPLESDRTAIGRSVHNQLQIDDSRVSRRHCQVYRVGRSFFVEDCRSKHGTFLNHTRIEESQELRDGDVIRIGRTTLRYLLEDHKVRIEDDPNPEGTSATTFSISSLMSECQFDTGDSDLRHETVPVAFREKALLFLRDYGLLLLQHARLESVFDASLEFASKAIPARRAALMLRDESTDRLTCKAFRCSDEMETQKPIRISRSILSAVFENNAALLTPDAQLDQRFSGSSSILKQGVHSAICSPIWNESRVMGLVYMDRGLNQKPFSKEELCLLSSLANMTALKVENARLFEESLEKRALEEQLMLASEIQRSLLPRRCPQLDSFDIAAFHSPCYQVGGDYYDFFELDGGLFGVALGDVSGKGPGAALLMASLRAFLSSQVRQGTALPLLAAELSRFIYESSPSEKYITFFFAVLDPKTGEIRFVNAGHNSPLIVGGTGKPLLLEATGLPLGVLPGSCYEQGAATVHPGQFLVIYTDGITERMNPDEEEFGLERLCRDIKRMGHLGAVDVVERTRDLVERFSGGAIQQDDMTLVIFRRR